MYTIHNNIFHIMHMGPYIFCIALRHWWISDQALIYADRWRQRLEKSVADFPKRMIMGYHG